MSAIEPDLILYRKATTDDVLKLQDLCATTFFDTYHMQNTAYDMQKYIATHFTPETLTKELQGSQISIFVVEYETKLIGYIKLELGNTSYMHEGRGCEIARYYVLKDYQQLKAGSKLMNISIKFALENNCNYIWLGVWQKNERAIEIYKHRGFIIAGTTTFTLGDDVQNDFIMVKRI